jgi:hypothetical protein
VWLTAPRERLVADAADAARVEGAAARRTEFQNYRGESIGEALSPALRARGPRWRLPERAGTGGRDMRIGIGTSLIGLSLLLAACGTVTGAAVGAGAGAAVGAGTGYGAKKGALIGTGVGAAAGAIYDLTKD